MIDKNFVGHKFSPFSSEVEKGQLKFFAKSIGETNPVYTDEKAAQAAGYRTIPAPATFMFSIDLNGPELMPIVDLLKLDLGKILHGTQDFEYLGQIYAGDNIAQTSEIVDIFDKKGGALEFVVIESSYTNQDNELVGKARQTLVYRN